MNAGDLLVVHCWYGLMPYSHFAIDMANGVTGFSANARLAIPSLVGEITEQVAKCSLKRCNASPHVVEQGSTLASYGTVAVLGLVIGGPAGSLSAIAAHSMARNTTRARHYS